MNLTIVNASDVLVLVRDKVSTTKASLGIILVINIIMPNNNFVTKISSNNRLFDL